jgi:hypothetical protein
MTRLDSCTRLCIYSLRFQAALLFLIYPSQQKRDYCIFVVYFKKFCLQLLLAPAEAWKQQRRGTVLGSTATDPNYTPNEPIAHQIIVR